MAASTRTGLTDRSGFDKRTLAGTLTGPCGRVGSPARSADEIRHLNARQRPGACRHRKMLLCGIPACQIRQFCAPRLTPEWTSRGEHIGGYRLSSGTQRKLRSVTGARWLCTQDRRFGAQDDQIAEADKGAPITQFRHAGFPGRTLRMARLLMPGKRSARLSLSGLRWAPEIRSTERDRESRARSG